MLNNKNKPNENSNCSYEKMLKVRRFFDDNFLRRFITLSVKTKLV